MTEEVKLAVTTCISLVIGFGAGYSAHRYTSKRERDERVRNFEALLLRWEQTIERTTDEAKVKALYYNELAPELRSEAAKVRRDFSDTATFNRLDEALTRIPPESLDQSGSGTRRDRLADAIRGLINFVREQ